MNTMDTERIIRELHREADKHKNDNLLTFQTNIAALCNDVIPKLETLRKYEEIGTVNECYGYKIHSQGIRTLNDCNNCGRKRNCTIKPRYGEYCRINCYLWEEDQNEPKS